MGRRHSVRMRGADCMWSVDRVRRTGAVELVAAGVVTVMASAVTAREPKKAIAAIPAAPSTTQKM